MGLASVIVVVEAKVSVEEGRPESVTVVAVSTFGSHVPLIAVYSETMIVVDVKLGCDPFDAGVCGTSALPRKGKNGLVALLSEALAGTDVMVAAGGELVAGGARSVRVCSKVPDGDIVRSVSVELGDSGVAAGG